jgi:ribosomal protein S18 acetylase RimI-like enzyme
MNNIKNFVPAITYVSLNNPTEFHTESIHAFKSGAQYYYCNQALLTGNCNADELHAMHAYFGTLPYTVWTNVHPNDQTQTFLAKEFKLPEPSLLMATKLNTISPAATKSEIEIRELTDKDTITHIWLPLVAEVYGTTTEEFTKFIAYLQQTSIANKLHYFIALFNGIPAATSMLIVHDNVIAVDWVGTLPAYRHKGLGFAVTSNALHLLKNEDTKPVALLATTAGQSLYKKIGLGVVDEYNVYMRN